MKRMYRFILSFLFVIDIINIFLIKIQQDCINNWKSLSNKHLSLFLLMNQWVSVKQENKKLELYFVNNNYKKIAVYGMSYVGKALIKELKDSKIEVVYGIDRNASIINSKIKIFTVDEPLPKVDAVVVTLVNGFGEISDLISKKMVCPVLAIEDIINEI